tara:strand:+ start:3648 stop:4106 length:459 start_codon:yes stop_codon:yes gene_type:complete
MYKNLLIIFLSVLLLNNCGYSPIYSKDNNQKLNIELVNFKGDREINNSIKLNLKRYQKQINETKFLIKTNSEYTKTSETKNLAGDTVSYNLSASVTFNVTHGDDEKVFKFNEKSSLKNLASQIDEDIYEANIKKNIGELFSNKLVMQLINMK